MSENAPEVAALIREVYPQLREMARRLLRKEREGHTLQPTALVNETFLKLFGKVPDDAMAPTRFLAFAAHQMRQVLVDSARRHKSQKRGSGLGHLPLVEVQISLGKDVGSLMMLNQLLDQLGRADRQALEVVELKFFGGFTNEETAAILEISSGTVEATWRYARLWLLREMKEPQPRRPKANGKPLLA